jgi:hypothetical protein
MQWFNKTTTPFHSYWDAVMAFPEELDSAEAFSASAAETDGVTGLAFASAVLRPLTSEEKALDLVYGGNAFCIEVTYTGEKA